MNGKQQKQLLPPLVRKAKDIFLSQDIRDLLNPSKANIKVHENAQVWQVQ